MDTLNGGTYQYLYDGEGRVCAVQSQAIDGVIVMTGYVYDADGVRAAKGTITSWSCDPSKNGFQTTEDYVLGPAGETLTEMEPNSQGAMAPQRTYIAAGGGQIAIYDPNGTHFRLTDWIGSLRATTDYAGIVESTCTNLPFGDGQSCMGPADPHYFTGKERDQESGNDYFGARYYASSMGRFLSPDWSAKEESVPYANLDEPQSLNLYSYVRNNPLVRMDADGHIDWNYLKDKFKQVFYAKVSVGAGLGGELKLTRNAEFKADVKAGIETRATVDGERTVAKVEGSAGVKVGAKEVGKSASVEMQVEKNGKVDIQKPTVQCCTMSAGSSSAQGTASGNDIGIEGHEGALGGEVGIDVDKAKEFGQAVKQQVNEEIQNDVNKILPK